MCYISRPEPSSSCQSLSFTLLTVLTRIFGIDSWYRTIGIRLLSTSALYRPPLVSASSQTVTSCGGRDETEAWGLRYLAGCGLANPTNCAKNVNIAITICNPPELPVAPEKVEGPVTAITFLGIEINSATMILSLLQGKLAALKAYSFMGWWRADISSI